MDEFIRRAEYTIRPDYCQGQNYIHKKIVLNSLIAEKMLAMEAGSDNELSRNDEFQNYLRGRKEQAMRQWYYYQEAYNEVIPDTAEIKKEYAVAGRTYKISYYSLSSDSPQDKIRERLKTDTTAFETIFKEIAGAENALPQKEIGYDKPEDEQIYAQLFLNPVQEGQVIGPLETADGSQLVLRVDGWTDEITLSGQQIQERCRTVKENITNRQALDIYERKVLEIMKGKRLEFNRDVFFTLAAVVATDYYKTEEEKKQSFQKKFWSEDRDEMVLDDRSNQLESIRDQQLFIIDGQAWTVREFEQELQSHPLVFRQRHFPRKRFAEQLKLAIVDMVRDKYITAAAYKKEYDKVATVDRNFHMWQDNLLALYQKHTYLSSINTQNKDQMKIITEDLNPYVQRLFKKYNDEIKIDVKRFEEIQLTGVDMFVIQRNVPFPVIVPGFPQLTTHDRLDYGQKM